MSRQDEPVAIRVLTTVGRVSPIRLELYSPMCAEEDDEAKYLVKGDWFCRYRIVQDERPVVDDVASGRDAFQAIINTISQIRGRFNGAGIDATYDDNIRGTGLPSYVPQFCGPVVERRLEKIIADEIEAWAKATK